MRDTTVDKIIAVLVALLFIGVFGGIVSAVFQVQVFMSLFGIIMVFSVFVISAFAIVDLIVDAFLKSR